MENINTIDELNHGSSITHSKADTLYLIPPDPSPEQVASELARDHIDWLLGMLRPLLRDHFIHGFKHGVEHRAGIKE